ncbi:MAG: hypothetical protein KKF65_06630, partial [Nanoarchaeota archaeon]|nr:hypothetical protein [Nanoarchaeota archaeon]
MNNKEFNKLKQFEWQEYAKRTHKTFIISVFIDVEGQALKKELGFECKNQIHHFNEKYLYFFRPKKEIDEANNFFLKILQDKSKLNNILIKSKEKNEEAKNILI